MKGNKMLFGEYLLALGKLKPKDVARVCNIQEKSVLPIGKLAVDNKFMTLADVLTICSHQKKSGALFGEVAINLNILKPRQVDALLELQGELRPLFGEILVKDGLMSEAEFLEHLRSFKANELSAPRTASPIVALVDVDKQNLFRMQSELMELGFNVVAQTFGADSMASLPSMNPAFVVIDISRERQEKLSALARLRATENFGPVRLLAMSDKLDAGEREAATAAGIGEIVPSGSNPRNIVAYIHGLLSGTTSAHTGKILLVDDSQTALRLMFHCLERENYETYLAKSGEEALRILKQNIPDLVLTDIYMPGMSGVELTELIKKNPETHSVPVVAVTTAKSISKLKEALFAGAVDYIVKPFQPDELLARVRSHIKTKRLMDEMEKSKKELLITNEKLAEANNKKIEFLAMVVHDLRAPLTSIQTYSELLGMSGTSMEDQKEFVGIIKTEVTRMSGLIKNYLDVSRIESATGIHSKTEVNIGEMASYFAKIFSTIAKKKSLQFASDFKDPDMVVTGNKEKLEQVFSNLLDNAVKYTPVGGKISFELSSTKIKNKKMAKIIVSDTGVGISPDAKQYIFKKFHFLHDGSAESSGLGLGLSICREIVEWHGGTIDVISEPGEGATFQVLIPA
ncbi:MAG: response regulator [Nitrospinae bacterium]|nr:response regulator [Nitrospinota bacterium]